MYGFLLTLLVLDGVFLAVVVLLQAGKGGGLAAMGGGAATTEVLGGRQATTLLTRATWISGSGFMAVALVLAIMSTRSTAPESVLESMVSPSQEAPEPLLPATGDDLLQIPGLSDVETEIEVPIGGAGREPQGIELPGEDG